MMGRLCSPQREATIKSSEYPPSLHAFNSGCALTTLLYGNGVHTGITMPSSTVDAPHLHNAVGVLPESLRGKQHAAAPDEVCALPAPSMRSNQQLAVLRTAKGAYASAVQQRGHAASVSERALPQVHLMLKAISSGRW